MDHGWQSRLLCPGTGCAESSSGWAGWGRHSNPELAPHPLTTSTMPILFKTAWVRRARQQRWEFAVLGPGPVPSSYSWAIRDSQAGLIIDPRVSKGVLHQTEHDEAKRHCAFIMNNVPGGGDHRHPHWCHRKGTGIQQLGSCILNCKKSCIFQDVCYWVHSLKLLRGD